MVVEETEPEYGGVLAFEVGHLGEMNCDQHLFRIASYSKAIFCLMVTLFCGLSP